jgi:hypothetical protein
MLSAEIGRLDGRDVVIETDLSAADIRKDGLPRSNARPPGHPGVRVAFVSRFGPLLYSTDAHMDWRHNLRAIALALEALRAVDRYGVTRRGEQYTGWAQLSAAPAKVDRNAAADILVSMGGGDESRIPTDATYREKVYRAAARAVHPDRLGGDGSRMARLNEAVAVLRHSDSL